LGNPLLELKEIDVYYGDAQVLQGVSLEVHEGEIVSLLGANGAGKTTLLKAISGLIRPRRGEIRFQNLRIDGLKPEAIVSLGIVHVPEGRRIFANLSVEENLKLGAYLHRSRKEVKDSLERVYQLFPILRERKRQKAGSLSGGEQQMLAIGRALMYQPKLMMLDEPSLGLSPIFVKTIFQLVKELNDKGITILLVEQNVHQALKISKIINVLKNGKIIYSGFGSEILKDGSILKAYLGAMS